MPEHIIDTIKSELDLAIQMLVIGFTKVSVSTSTSEAVVMRTTRYLLENLYRYVECREEEETS